MVSQMHLLLRSLAKQGVPGFTTEFSKTRSPRIHYTRPSVSMFINEVLSIIAIAEKLNPKHVSRMLSESEFCEAGNHIYAVLLFRDTIIIILPRSNWLMSLERILLRRSCTFSLFLSQVHTYSFEEPNVMEYIYHYTYNCTFEKARLIKANKCGKL